MSHSLSGSTYSDKVPRLESGQIARARAYNHPYLGQRIQALQLERERGAMLWRSILLECVYGRSKARLLLHKRVRCVSSQASTQAGDAVSRFLQPNEGPGVITREHFNTVQAG